MRPIINITPLIDVLLVLIIIFMVVAPLRPYSFKTRVPQEPKPDRREITNIQTIVAAIGPDGSVRLNSESGLGSIDDLTKLTERLRTIFDERNNNGDVSESFADAPERPYADRIERSVFVKAPKGAGYGRVAKLIDAVKSAGAFPIALQIDELEN